MQGDNETPRFCVERDHEKFYATLHCTFENCQQKSRWVCASCLFWKLHDHGKLQTKHIVKEDELIKTMQQFKQQISEKMSHQIEDLTSELMKQQEELKYSLENYTILKSQEFIYNQNVCLVEVQKLIGIIKEFQNTLLIMFQQIKKDVRDLNQQVKNEKQEQNKIWEQGFCFLEPQYTGQDHKLQNDLNQSVINNQINQQMEDEFEKYNKNTQLIIHNNELVRTNDRTLQLFNLQNKSLKKQIQLKTEITSIGFNFDGTILFYGDCWGNLYAFSVLKNYQLIFKRKVRNLSLKIKQIYSIFDELITLSDNNIIEIWNFRNKKLISKYKLKLDNYVIKNFNYDFIKGNFIVQNNNKIYILYRYNHKVILHDQQFSEFGVIDIQFVQPSFLVFLSDDTLKKVDINYQQRKLSCFQQFARQTSHKFLTFSFVDYGNNFIIISEDSVYILNQNLFVLQLIQIESDRISNIKVKQINSMDNIIIIKNGKIFFNQDKFDFWQIFQAQIEDNSKFVNNQYFLGNIFNYPNDYYICLIIIYNPNYKCNSKYVYNSDFKFFMAIFLHWNMNNLQNASRQTS